MTINAVDVIRTKRDGAELSDEQIRWFLAAYTAGEVADEQASALCMAIVFRGLVPRELATWTAAMIDSGERLDLAGVGRPTVDKHSTGGVGDKVSLVLVPLVAACGVAVPQLSGRGLGHTGGTLDKMEAIPGWRANLTPDEMIAALRSVGGVIAAAGPGLVPADRKLYALRDVTATVESIPLIASSIMSKKIAEGTDALVLDVKFGSGAFLPDPREGRLLAETMVGLGEAHGVRTAALQTSMETVLGRAAGNAVEVTESVETLQGGGPPDLVEVTVELARTMLTLAGRGDADPADVLGSGKAFETWRAVVRVQGGDPDAPLPGPNEIEVVRARTSGVLTRLDARAVGVAAWRLGAGRARKEDPVSAAAGVICRAKPGDAVREGDVVLELHVDDPARLGAALDALTDAFDIGATAPEPQPLVLARIGV
ncbi:MAG: thymidine phosphorylase [Actinomycetota bacterium]|nr:thymidine phosphorylase [Actinomycetota bacterium]